MVHDKIEFGRLFDRDVARPRDQAALEPQDPPDEPSGDRPACAREEAYAEPDADQVEGDGGGHVAILPMVT